MASRIVTGICALCRKPNRLRESHILPEFLWRNSGVTAGRNKYDIISLGDPRDSKLHQQTGPHEYLCCKACELKMSRWEDAAKRIWFDGNSPFRHERPDPAGVHLNGVPYAEFKLFLMSMLWKMGVSKNHYYGPVHLSASEQQRIRRLLMANVPGEPWRYGCRVSILCHQGKLLADYFSQPAEVVSEVLQDHTYFCLIAAGVLLVFAVGGKPPPIAISRDYLTARSPWAIKTEEIRLYPELWERYQTWAEANAVEL